MPVQLECTEPPENPASEKNYSKSSIKTAREELPADKFNVRSIPGKLLESRIVRYEKGSFTGQVHGKMGLWKRAKRSLLVWMRIGELRVKLSGSCFGQFRKGNYTVGGMVPQSGRRIIAAPIKNLQAYRQGLFREDLYYRLSYFQLRFCR
jgi:two-component system nitrogen regulation response regulator GlnG